MQCFYRLHESSMAKMPITAVRITFKKGDAAMAVNVYMIDMDGNPLMPCHNGGFVRSALKEGRAEVVRRKPFTIQLKYAVRNRYTQEIALGVDSATVKQDSATESVQNRKAGLLRH